MRIGSLRDAGEGFWGFVAVLLAIGGCGVLIARAPHGTAHTGPPRLVAPDGGNVYVATSESAYDRFTDLAVAGDVIGINHMLASGELLVTPSGTSCTVISRGFLVTEVRITEGVHRGRSAFVASERVAGH